MTVGDQEMAFLAHHATCTACWSAAISRAWTPSWRPWPTSPTASGSPSTGGARPTCGRCGRCWTGAWRRPNACPRRPGDRRAAAERVRDLPVRARPAGRHPLDAGPAGRAPGGDPGPRGAVLVACPLAQRAGRGRAGRRAGGQGGGRAPRPVGLRRPAPGRALAPAPLQPCRGLCPARRRASGGAALPAAVAVCRPQRDLDHHDALRAGRAAAWDGGRHARAVGGGGTAFQLAMERCNRLGAPAITARVLYERSRMLVARARRPTWPAPPSCLPGRRASAGSWTCPGSGTVSRRLPTRSIRAGMWPWRALRAGCRLPARGRLLDGGLRGRDGPLSGT